VQTGDPEPHAVTPVRHGSAGSQVAPASQALQAPPPQTAFVPQLSPSATLAPMSTHTAAPEEQEVLPTWHAFAGVQLAPATQATHAPALQTWSAPQVVPSGSFPLSVQTGAPLPHAIAPVLHGVAGSHATPASQALHVPPPQTAFVPQLAPSATLAPVSTHTAAPEEQEVLPT
jgi:hypothetical protein